MDVRNSFGVLACEAARGDALGRGSRSRKGRARAARQQQQQQQASASKPLGEPVDCVSDDRDDNDTANASGDEEWMCARCTYVTVDNARICSVCQEPAAGDLPDPDPQEPPIVSTSSPARSDDPIPEEKLRAAPLTFLMPPVQAARPMPPPGTNDLRSFPSLVPSSSSFATTSTPPPAPAPFVEQAQHEQYMQEFRVYMCQAHAQKACPNDSYTCFHSHSKHTRRKPVLVSADEYNYAPTRCRYVQTSHGKRRCPQGDACRYAHSTEEMIYHPLVYKTQLCPHALQNGICTGFGQHCAKAHGPGELRFPAPCHTAAERSFLKSHPGGASGSPSSFPVTIATDVELGITRDNPAYYMLCYKTDRCPQKSCPRTCERYHNLKERRRCPKFFFYSEQPCPYVKSGGATKNWRDPSRCPDGDACRYSHTLLEQMYHPNIYKTSPCNNYSETDPSRCTWGPLCTHAHGLADMQRQGRALAAYERDIAAGTTTSAQRPSAASTTMAAAVAASAAARARLQSTTNDPVLGASPRDHGPAAAAPGGGLERPRFILPPPLPALIDRNQIWQPTPADSAFDNSFRIWNDSAAGLSSWAPSASRSRSSSPALGMGSSSGSEELNLRMLQMKVEQLEMDKAHLVELSSRREAEAESWRRECQRLVSQVICPVCGGIADAGQISCPTCQQSLAGATSDLDL